MRSTRCVRTHAARVTVASVGSNGGACARAASASLTRPRLPASPPPPPPRALQYVCGDNAYGPPGSVAQLLPQGSRGTKAAVWTVQDVPAGGTAEVWIRFTLDGESPAVDAAAAAASTTAATAQAVAPTGASVAAPAPQRSARAPVPPPMLVRSESSGEFFELAELAAEARQSAAAAAGTGAAEVGGLVMPPVISRVASSGDDGFFFGGGDSGANSSRGRSRQASGGSADDLVVRHAGPPLAVAPPTGGGGLEACEVDPTLGLGLSAPSSPAKASSDAPAPRSGGASGDSSQLHSHSGGGGGGGSSFNVLELVSRLGGFTPAGKGGLAHPPRHAATEQPPLVAPHLPPLATAGHGHHATTAHAQSARFPLALARQSSVGDSGSSVTSAAGSAADYGGSASSAPQTMESARGDPLSLPSHRHETPGTARAGQGYSDAHLQHSPHDGDVRDAGSSSGRLRTGAAGPGSASSYPMVTGDVYSPAKACVSGVDMQFHAQSHLLAHLQQQQQQPGLGEVAALPGTLLQAAAGEPPERGGGETTRAGRAAAMTRALSYHSDGHHGDFQDTVSLSSGPLAGFSHGAAGGAGATGETTQRSSTSAPASGASVSGASRPGLGSLLPLSWRGTRLALAQVLTQPTQPLSQLGLSDDGGALASSKRQPLSGRGAGPVAPSYYSPLGLLGFDDFLSVVQARRDEADEFYDGSFSGGSEPPCAPTAAAPGHTRAQRKSTPRLPLFSRACSHPAAEPARRGPLHPAPGLLRAAVVQAVLPLRRGAVARRRPRVPAAAT